MELNDDVKIFKTCQRYLTHIQNSVFEGDKQSAAGKPTAGTETDVDPSWILIISSNHVRKMDGQGILGQKKMT